VTFLDVSGLCKGWDFPVVDNLSLQVEQGEIVTLLGPAGSGKSTIIRLISGLENPDLGSISIGGEDVTRKAVFRRHTGMAADPADLYPWATVAQNLLSPLEARGMPADNRQKQLRHLAGRFMLEEVLDKRPDLLSPSEKVRALLARALASGPRVLLLDDPLRQLAGPARVSTRRLVRETAERRYSACVFATRDYEDALAVSDRIAVLDGSGHIVQLGSPRDVFERPASLIVAQAFGLPPINVISCQIRTRKGELFIGPADGGFEFPVERRHQDTIAAIRERAVTIGIRPQHLRAGGEVNRLSAIDAIVDMAFMTAAGGILVARAGGSWLSSMVSDVRAFRQGAAVKLTVKPRHVHLFDAVTGRNLTV
jgi:ABC-type sugar transport system ATPase subunit